MINKGNFYFKIFIEKSIIVERNEIKVEYKKERPICRVDIFYKLVCG
jgi:hypothetical protein